MWVELESIRSQSTSIPHLHYTLPHASDRLDVFLLVYADNGPFTGLGHRGVCVWILVSPDSSEIVFAGISVVV